LTFNDISRIICCYIDFHVPNIAQLIVEQNRVHLTMAPSNEEGDNAEE